MSTRSQNILIFFILITLFWLLGFNQYYAFPPDSFHLGAQTDRASIVLNYANGSADFLYPKIMETRVSEGIVGCEFPGLYYVLGKVFSVTGFRYDIYRIVIWLFYFLGIWSFYQISRLYLNFTISLFISIALASSPILCFYGLNFLPDVPAFGLSMFGWWMLLGKKRKKLFLILGFLVLGLAGLVKASFAMHIVVAFSIYIVENKKIKWEVLVSGLISLAAIAGWYEWATHLNNKFQNPHFLLKPNPAVSFPNFLVLIKSNWANWARETYPIITLIIALSGIFFQFKNRKTQSTLFKISSRLFICWVAFYLLFQTQFKYHDYYLVAAIPLLFFLIIHFGVYLKRITLSTIILYVVFGFILFQNFNHAKKQLNERHKTSSYYYQPPMPGIIEKYIGINSFLDAHIPKDAKIITVFDNTPNSTLFFCRRKGGRIAEDFNDELIAEILNEPQFDYMLVNKPILFKERLSKIEYELNEPIATYKGIMLYKTR
jgi:4-amino-4-deoxy-L-arabinose transferase-like glycosyltransferase